MGANSWKIICKTAASKIRESQSLTELSLKLVGVQAPVTDITPWDFPDADDRSCDHPTGAFRRKWSSFLHSHRGGTAVFFVSWVGLEGVENENYKRATDALGQSIYVIGGIVLPKR